MIDSLIKSILEHEGPATMVTTGPDGPNLVATWQSYILVVDDQTIAFPAGGYRRTEENIRAGSPVQMIIGARILTSRGSGVGFRLTGKAELEAETPLHERLKERFPWCRAAVVMRLTEVERILG